MPKSKNKNEWVREGLNKRGYRQKDLAVAWGSQQASVSRFFSGEELQDLTLSKAVPLARMLGISLDELAKGLGHVGEAVEPSIKSEVVMQSIPLGSMNMTTIKPGVVRLEIRKDLSVAAAQEVVKVVAVDDISGLAS